MKYLLLFKWNDIKIAPIYKKIWISKFHSHTLGIDVGQGINVGPGKFGKTNKRRSYVVNNHLNNLYVLSNKAVGPGKKSKVNKCRAYVYSGG